MVKPWSCYMPGCKSRIARNTPSEINRHLKTHIPRERWKYQCPHLGCGFASIQEINYKIHRKIHDKTNVKLRPSKRHKIMDSDLAPESSTAGEVACAFTEVTGGSVDAYEEQQETREPLVPFPVVGQLGVAAGSAHGIDSLVSSRARRIGLATAVGTVISQLRAEIYEPCNPTSTLSNRDHEPLRSYVLGRGVYPKLSLMETVIEGDQTSYFGHSEVAHSIRKRDPPFCTLVGNDNNPITLCKRKCWGPVPEAQAPITLRLVSLGDWATPAADFNNSDDGGKAANLPQPAPIPPVSDKLPPKMRKDLFKNTTFWNAA